MWGDVPSEGSLHIKLPNLRRPYSTVAARLKLTGCSKAQVPTMGSLPTELDLFQSTKFTHLVIGGGTAGLVVAARLSENKDVVVGVLEAGLAAFDEPGIKVPGRFCETLDTEYDWQFVTVPQPGFNGRSLPWPRGKVLGGTSALNIMTWNRGCREDYDAWEELGNEGWGWDGLLYDHNYHLRTLCTYFHAAHSSRRVSDSTSLTPKIRP